MPDNPPLRRPSDDIIELQKQLLRELEGFQRDGDSWSEPALFRAYLQHAQTLAWQGVANGNLNAPREVLDLLLSAQPFVDSYLPASPGLTAQAALEVHQAIRVLYLGDQVLEDVRTRVRLADRDRSRTEREILRVLFKNRENYLRRGAVRHRMNPQDRPTPARVGQILVDLHGEGLVLRMHGRAQGHPSAAFYALSPRGFEVCESLGLNDISVQTDRIRSILQRIFDSESSPDQRKMLLDPLSTTRDLAIGDLVIEVLEDNIRQETDPVKARLYKDTLLQVFLARRRIDFGSGASDERPGVYVLKSPNEAQTDLVSQAIVDAFITDLEKGLNDEEGRTSVRPKAAQDYLIHILKTERQRLTPHRSPATT